MYQRQLDDVKATRNHTLYDSRKSERLWPYGCTPVDEKERVGGSWLSRGVPTPRVPRTRELRTRGAPRGSSRPMLAIQLLAIRVMYASTGDVLESNVEQFPTTTCSGLLLAQDSLEKAWTDIVQGDGGTEITRLLVSPARAIIKWGRRGGQENVTLLDGRRHKEISRPQVVTESCRDRRPAAH